MAGSGAGSGDLRGDRAGRRWSGGCSLPALLARWAGSTVFSGARLATGFPSTGTLGRAGIASGGRLRDCGGNETTDDGAGGDDGSADGDGSADETAGGAASGSA